MSSLFSFDIAYWLNPHLVTRIKDSRSVAIFGAGTPLEISFDLFQVLMLFAEKKTTRQALQMLNADIDSEEFAGVVGRFLDCGLLKREELDDQAHSLQGLLNPRIFADPRLVDSLGNWVRLGRIVVIPDALPAAFAERVHDDLDHSTAWNVAEGGHGFFHYRNCGIDNIEGMGPALNECHQLFTSTATRRFMSGLSGRDCSGEAGVVATWYRPGEYALPHDDSATNSARSVAYIWYLTKSWRQEWGGSLFWCPTGQHIRPMFNAMAIFNVSSSNVHFVCPVAGTATAKRLSINGFWHNPERGLRSPPLSPDSVVSSLAYGQPASNTSDLAPIIVV